MIEPRLVSKQWPTAVAVNATATMKAQLTDFQVLELPLAAPTMARSTCFDGQAQRLLYVQKLGLNTGFVAQLLARWAGIATVEVGYAGRKDRYACTQQWFSMPDQAFRKADSQQPFEHYVETHLTATESLQVLAMAWQPKKLRIGALWGNRFRVVLRSAAQVTDAALGAAAQRWQVRGAPNYFGPQRFGRDNLLAAQRWLAQRSDRAARTHRGPERRRGRGPRGRRRDSQAQVDAGWHLSTLRSFLFNEVLAARVRADNFWQLLPGDVAEVCEAGDWPTGPLWGRGRSASTVAALAIEAAALAPYQALLEQLEYSGATQQRRPLSVRARNLTWHRQDDALTIGFELPAGAYATTVLGELAELNDASLSVPVVPPLAADARGGALA